MDLFDEFEGIDSQENFLNFDYVPDPENKYLSSEAEALQFIAQFIPLKGTKSDNYSQEKQIKKMLELQFLNMFQKIELSNKAQLQQQLEMLSDKLLEQKKYNMLKDKVVIGLGGKFSAGKSKFINSLLKAGEEFLPEDQNPTTSIPTYIVQGKIDEINAYTNSGDKVTLDFEALQALTHKFYRKFGIGFSSFIHSLVISEDDMPYSGMAFLDTPGYNKPDAVDEVQLQKSDSDQNKAYEQLRKVDYLIWLMDIENGVIQQNDIEFIESLNLKNPILIVVNKADKKIDRDIEKIVNLVNKTAEDAGINVFGVAAYSSRENKEWGNSDIINHFLELASKTKVKSGDVMGEVHGIKTKILEELKASEASWIRSRNHLSNTIADSESILDIRTLVDLYGDALEGVRLVKRSLYQFNDYMKKLEDKLEEYYEG